MVRPFEGTFREVRSSGTGPSGCATIADAPPVLQDAPFLGGGTGLLRLAFLFHGLVVDELARLFRLASGHLRGAVVAAPRASRSSMRPYPSDRRRNLGPRRSALGQREKARESSFADRRHRAPETENGRSQRPRFRHAGLEFHDLSGDPDGAGRGGVRAGPDAHFFGRSTPRSNRGCSCCARTRSARSRRPGRR